MSILELTEDDVRLGKYRLVATLGQGGMGTVYLAVARGLGEFQKLLVVKELRRDLTRKPAFVRMFMDEAKLAARLSHPNVVQTLEAAQEGDRYFLAMEYLEGQPLSAVLKRLLQQDRLPLSHWLYMLCEVLSGLHYAHELCDYDGQPLGVVHRDISPHNVFVTYHGEIKVVDFGVAKATTASDLTNPGVFKGKFAYAAPEQVQGRPVDRRADVFAVGVMLWEAIARRRLVRGSPTPEAYDARTQGEEPKIASVVPDVDPLLAEICDRAMALDPRDRHATAAELRGALCEYLMLIGEHVDNAAIRTLVNAAFAADRAEVRGVIEARLRSLATEEGSTESVPDLAHAAHDAVNESIGATDASELEPSGSIDEGLAALLEPEPSPSGDDSQLSGAIRAMRSRRWRAPAVIAAIVLAGATWIFLASRPSSDVADAKKPAVTETATETGTATETATETAAETGTESGTVTGSETETVTGSETVTESETVTGSGTGTGAETGTVTGAETVTGSRPRARPPQAVVPATTRAKQPTAPAPSARNQAATRRQPAADTLAAPVPNPDPAKSSAARRPSAADSTAAKTASADKPAEMPVRAGDDLRQLERVRRSIDTEDPY